MNKWTLFGVIFCTTFIIYNLNFNIVGSSDSLPARVLPFNILSGKGIYLDEYVNFLTGDLYYLYKFNNHYITAYPTIMGILPLPVYLPMYIYMELSGLTNSENLFKASFFLEKISASIIASLSVCLMYLLFYKISKNNKFSLLFSFIFAFATQTFSISSQALWQHGGANLFLIISLILYVQALKTSSTRTLYFILALLFAIFSFWTRLNFFIYLITILGLIIWIDRKKTILYLMVALLGLLILVSFNLYFYNSIIGGYAQTSRVVEGGNFWSGLLELLFSPSRGTLFYTPFFFFSFLSLIFVKKIINNFVYKYIFLLAFLYFVLGATLNFFWGGWWGGWSWGNRLLTDIAVPAVLLSYFFL